MQECPRAIGLSPRSTSKRAARPSLLHCSSPSDSKLPGGAVLPGSRDSWRHTLPLELPTLLPATLAQVAPAAPLAATAATRAIQRAHQSPTTESHWANAPPD